MPEIEFTYKEVSAEYARIGYTYPNDEDFTEEEIAEAVRSLSSYYLVEEVASLSGENHAPEVVKKFAELAVVLKAGITVSGQSLKVQRDTTTKQRRDSALANLKSSRDLMFRDFARNSLKSKAELEG